MNNSIIQINGIHAESKVYPASEHSTDWYAILTIRDEHDNEIEILINNGKIVESQWKE
jgi:hypothetical protein